ncbi:MAG: peptidase S9, partial [Rhodothermales bacterium]|nr:peptidase S9 [Rhodothermales bacterium]
DNNNYAVHALEGEALVGVSVEPVADEGALSGYALAGLLPPFRAVDEGLVGDYLNDPLTGLPSNQDYDAKEYRSKLRLDYVAPPSVGVQVGGVYGGGLAGGVGFFFSDMLGNQNLTIVAQANGTFKDLGGQVSYLNRGNRLNWGGAAGHIPLLFGGTRVGFTPDGFQFVEEVRQRIFIDQLLGIASYPFSTTRRLELNGGFIRYGFNYESIRFTFTPFGIDRDRQGAEKCSDLDPQFQGSFLCEPDAIYFAQGGLAYVGDFANFGFTSPVQGGRYRLEVSPRVGTDSYVTALADYRRYFFQNPFTFAVRGMHIGNYGATEDEIFAQEYLGYSYYPGFVRGYSFNSFDVEECLDETGGVSAGGCGPFDRLFGTRLALASAELRLPLLGTESLGLINFPYLPTELTGFVDAGLAWNEGDNPFDLLAFERRTNERVPVVSVGTSARFNVLGYLVFEVYYAYPFQRPDKGAHFGVQLLPGW